MKNLESKQQKPFGIVVDWDLKVDENILPQCIKAGKQFSALIRISKFMTFSRKKNIMKASTESHFGYFPLIWMLYGRQTNVDINQIHEMANIAVYNHEISLFEELIGKDK